MTDDKTQAEIDEGHRDRTIWTTLIVVGVLVAAGVMYLGWGIVEGRLEAAKKLDRALEILKQTEPTMNAVDEIIRAKPDSNTAARIGAIAPRVDTARTQLLEAAELSSAGFDRLTDDEQEQALLTQAASEARVVALDAARVVLTARTTDSVSRGSAVDALTAEYLKAKQKSSEADTALRTN